MSNLDEILDSVFHGCAFKAFVEVAHEMQGPPCPIRTRQRAYKLYEESLAEKNCSTVSERNGASHR